MLPLRRYGIKTKVGLTRGKRSGQTRSRAKKPQDGGKSRQQNKNLGKNQQDKNHTKDSDFSFNSSSLVTKRYYYYYYLRDYCTTSVLTVHHQPTTNYIIILISTISTLGGCPLSHTRVVCTLSSLCVFVFKISFSRKIYTLRPG